MKKRNICIIGHFGKNYNFYDGQTIKTRILENQLIKYNLPEKIVRVDTYNWKKHPIKLFLNCFTNCFKCKNIILLPSANGIKVFIPLFSLFKKIFSIKVHYILIGSWLIDKLENNKKLLNKLSNIDCIYVENKKIIFKLNEMGITHTYYLPNFKELNKSSNMIFNDNMFKCCIFSRIEKMKGILDAVDVVNKYNSNHDKKIYLDIYGKIKNEFSEEFSNYINNNDFIKYCGVVDFDKSVSVIEKYNLLLFPTKYQTEGVPGTIIDAFFSGVPVLASKWENFDEIIIEKYNGFGYNFDNIDDFYTKLSEIINNQGILIDMKKNCLKCADKYLPENALKILLENMR